MLDRAARDEAAGDRLRAMHREAERYENWMQKRPTPEHYIRIAMYPGRDQYQSLTFYRPTCTCGWRTKGVTRTRSVAEQQAAEHKAAT